MVTLWRSTYLKRPLYIDGICKRLILKVNITDCGWNTLIVQKSLSKGRSTIYWHVAAIGFLNFAVALHYSESTDFPEYVHQRVEFHLIIERIILISLSNRMRKAAINSGLGKWFGLVFACSAKINKIRMWTTFVSRYEKYFHAISGQFKQPRMFNESETVVHWPDQACPPCEIPSYWNWGSCTRSQEREIHKHCFPQSLDEWPNSDLGMSLLPLLLRYSMRDMIMDTRMHSSSSVSVPLVHRNSRRHWRNS